MASSPASKIVLAGVKRLGADFTIRIAPLGFRKMGRRLWTRENELTVEKIHFHRRGSTYGSPINMSVDIRVELSVQKLVNPASATGPVMFSDKFRKADGYAYHHRFNAQTWSTYDRCLDELVLFVIDVAEPWFADPTTLPG